jgi:putative DNA primase/helicase
MAYCLLPSYPLHRLFCFVGGGLNGKSTFLEILRKFIGNENCCSTELDLLLKSRFEVTRLHKKLMAQMGETDFEEMSKTSILKKLTGGDLIGFEYKNKTPFEEKNYAKIIIATNNLPTTTDKTIGFYRRWLIIDFPNQFSEKRNILEEIPNEEYEALSVKLLGVLKDLLDEKQFHNEGDIEQRMKKYEDKSNFLGKFLEEYTLRSEGSFVTKNVFYKRFIEWCKENRHRQITEMKLAYQMKEAGIEGGKDYIEWEEYGNLRKKQVRTWKDIKWKHGE